MNRIHKGVFRNSQVVSSELNPSVYMHTHAHTLTGDAELWRSSWVTGARFESSGSYNKGTNVIRLSVTRAGVQNCPTQGGDGEGKA